MLKEPKMKILANNIWRAQRVFFSHLVIMGVTIQDWDILNLLRDGLQMTDGAVASDEEDEDEDSADEARQSSSQHASEADLRTARRESASDAPGSIPGGSILSKMCSCGSRDVQVKTVVFHDNSANNSAPNNSTYEQLNRKRSSAAFDGNAAFSALKY